MRNRPNGALLLTTSPGRPPATTTTIIIFLSRKVDIKLRYRPPHCKGVEGTPPSPYIMRA